MFPSPVFPLYFSLSSSRLFCALSQRQLPLHYFSLIPSSPRPIPLALSSVTLSCPCFPLSPLLLPSHLSVLLPLPSAVIPPWLSPISHTVVPPADDPVLLELLSKATLLQPLMIDVPLLSLAPLLKAAYDTGCCRCLLSPQGTTAPSEMGGETQPPPFLLPSLPVVKPTSLHFAASNLPWPEGSLAAQLMSWLICMQPAIGLEGAPGSPKYPPWQPSDTNQAGVQRENQGLCSHRPGAVVVHYREGSLVVSKQGLSKQPSFASCLQGEDFL